MEIRTDYSDIRFKDDGRLKLLIIVGTRPEIIRLAAVITKCREYFDCLLAHTGQNYDCREYFDCLLAHTGQNYDYNLNGVFFKDLKLGNPDVYMDAVGDDLGATVGNIINASYKLMVQTGPDAVLVLGDTNSCLSVIGAKRLHIGRQPLQGRVPAGGDQQKDSGHHLGRQPVLLGARKALPHRVRPAEGEDLRYRFSDG